LSFKNATDHHVAYDDDLLPLPILTPTVLLGAADPTREGQGQLYASQIATAISMRNPEERRMVLLGLGFESATHDRQTFIDILALVGQCLS
jgi:proteasome assembly chaperone 3